MEKQRYERPIIQRTNSGISNKFGSKNQSGSVRYIDNNLTDGLLKQFGSPLYILSEKTIRRNIQNANRIFKTRYPKVQFAWSYKTNNLKAVCNIYHQEGSWAEVVSGAEYSKALRNGIPGKNIIFNGPVKSESDLQLACENGSYIHIDHTEELIQLIAISKTSKQKPRVGVRINMDTGIYPKWDRFGFNYENGQAWKIIEQIMDTDSLELTGLHCHIGTFMLSPEAYRKATEALCHLNWNLRERYNKTLQYFDLGGGFPSTNTLKGAYLPGTDTTPSLDQFADVITNCILTYGFKQNELPLLILETGRALIDDAGYILGTVLASKSLSDGRRACILDFGVNNLFTSFWYEHKISPTQDYGDYSEEMVLYGPLCMNIDVVRESILLPPLAPGDHVVVHQTGAYNMTQWMQFITLRPAVVLIDTNDNPSIIRMAEEVEYTEMPERLPDHLQ